MMWYIGFLIGLLCVVAWHLLKYKPLNLIDWKI